MSRITLSSPGGRVTASQNMATPRDLDSIAAVTVLIPVTQKAA